MLYWASTQLSGPILECFAPISYHFRQSLRAFNLKNRCWAVFVARRPPATLMCLLGELYRKFEEST
jgi:hypothetical protein